MIGFKGFSESLEGARLDGMLKSQIWNEPFSGKDHGLYVASPWSFVQKTGPKYTHLKSLSIKLSENQKINVIGPTELKLWLFKDAYIHHPLGSYR